MIVGIAGYKGSGKDTAGSVLTDKFGWDKMSFAYPIKKITNEVFDIPMDILDPKNENDRLTRDGSQFSRFEKTPRQLLQIIGTGFRDLIHPDVWVSKVEQMYLSGDNHVVITDVRFPNEVDMISKYGFVVGIKRPGFNGDQHISERALDNIALKYIINNDGGINYLKSKMDGLCRCKVGPFYKGMDGEELHRSY